MIATLTGTVAEANLHEVVLEVQGVGYLVAVPATTAERLPPVGGAVKLYTLAVYREDTQALFGFMVREERDFFRLLIEKVTGIGPKIALTILGRLSLPMLKQAIAASDYALLSKCPGIGRKTAERLVTELRDVIGTLPTAPAPALGTVPLAPGSVSPGAPGPALHFQDAVSALVALGYRLADADKAIRRAAHQLGEGANTEDLVKRALTGG